VTRVLGTYRPSFLLRDFACQLVQQRIGVYADEITRQLTPPGEDIPRVERPKTIVARERALRLRHEQVPAIIIATPGNGDADLRDAEGNYRAPYLMEVHAIVESTNEGVGYQAASVLATAATAVLLDGLGGGLDGLVGKPVWVAEGADDTFAGEQTRHGSVHILTVPYSPISESPGPLPGDWTDPAIGEPPIDPGDLPTVSAVGMNVTPVKEIAE
jgi:hypothetical protein